VSEAQIPANQPNLSGDGPSSPAASVAEPRSVAPKTKTHDAGTAGRRAAAKAQSAIDKAVDRLADGVTGSIPSSPNVPMPRWGSASPWAFCSACSSLRARASSM
jgi:hypothetical protein